MKGDKFLSNFLIVLYAAIIVVMAYFYWAGADSSIDWKVTTHAEPSTFSAHDFQKGPFQFSLSGDFYSLTESFSAGPIERHLTRDGIFLALTWLGICLLLSLSTYLSRIWFTGVAGLFIFMIINLHLSEVGIFGFSQFSFWGNVILIALFIAPAYIFQAFAKYVSFWVRILVFILISVGVILFSGVDLMQFQEQLNVGLYFSIIVLMLLFLLIVAEENVFGILYLITKSRGGEHNEKHFSVFSLIYLGYVGLAYGKKSGLIKMELPFFDPYVLLIISSAVVIWSLKYKRELYQNLFTENHALQMLAAIGLTIFSYLALAFARGNDPVFEGFHYFIIYAHLGFGAFFFFYIIANFVNPLIKGLQIYKVAYKEQNLPYVTARIGGLIAVVAFFFLADKEPFKLFRAGHYNYLGEQAELMRENALADEYYFEASVYGYDNHFTHYKIGYRNLQKGKIKDANFQFGRAALRFPTPQSFINQSSTFGLLNEVTPSLISLESGLRLYPGNNALLNNLGLIYTDLGKYEKAGSYFRQADERGEWNHANTVNLLKIGMGEDLTEDYNNGNLAVKTNVLANAISLNQELPINFTPENVKISHPLHRNTFLINSAWYFNDIEANQLLNEATMSPMDESLYEHSVHALALSTYQNGNINLAIRKLDQLQYQAKTEDQTKYLNELGLICLEQNAPDLAHDFFSRAIELGNIDAQMNKAVALLESGDFEQAINWLQNIDQTDTTKSALADQFTSILTGIRTSLTADQRAIHAYYKYSDYSPAEISSLVASQSTYYVKTLWNKISSELLKSESYEQLATYFSIFKPALDPSDYEEYLGIIALNKNLGLSGESPIALALNQVDSVRTSSLYDLANKNALNSPLVLAVAKYIQKDDLQRSYDLLVDAIDLNPDNIGLLKAYAFAALEVRLSAYAQPALNKLSNLMTAESFSDFQKRFNERKSGLEKLDDNW